MCKWYFNSLLDFNNECFAGYFTDEDIKSEMPLFYYNSKIPVISSLQVVAIINKS